MKTAEEFYEEMRAKGLTYNITGNPDPDYKLPFYQNIFRLMEVFAKKYASQLYSSGEEVLPVNMVHTHIPILDGKAHITWHGDDDPSEKQINAFEKMVKLAIENATGILSGKEVYVKCDRDDSEAEFEAYEICCTIYEKQSFWFKKLPRPVVTKGDIDKSWHKNSEPYNEGIHRYMLYEQFKTAILELLNQKR